jgi:cell division septum initiation protein DivIVA
MSQASELFREVAIRCPHQTNVEMSAWIDWVAKEMERVKNFNRDLSALEAEMESAKKKYADALEVIRKRRFELQKHCNHKWTRATAESDTICKVCGKNDHDDWVGG